MLRRHSSIVAPVLMLGIGMYLLVGCIPLPGNFKMRSGKLRPEQYIGQPGSNKPIRVGQSSVDQTTAYLGSPRLVSPDRSVVVYEYDVNITSTFWPLCFWAGLQKQFTARYLMLRFDEYGRLSHYKVYKELLEVRRDAGVALEITNPTPAYRRPAQPARELPASSPVDDRRPTGTRYETK